MSACNWLSAVEVAGRVADGSLPAETVLDSCLRRIDEREGSVGALEYLDGEGASGKAAAVDRQGLLAGVVVGIKDNIDTADMPTTCGSHIYRNRRPVEDAASVLRLRQAGAIVLCKTVTAEFAGNDVVRTANPADFAHSPGGSSSGSAAAVADGMVHIALGTQTGGSVVRPAAYCGVVGYKPTFGAIARSGVKPLSETLDTVGVLARSVRDVSLVASALTGRTKLAATHGGVAGLRFLVCETPFWGEAEPETRELLYMLRGALGEHLSSEVGVLELPPPFSQANDIHKIVMSYEGRRALAYEFEEKSALMGPRMRNLLKLGETWSQAEYRSAIEAMEELRRLFADIIDDRTIIVTPSAPGIAPRDRTTTGSPVFNCMWTSLHVPAITVPAGAASGLPLGIQLVALPDCDATLLRAADMIERIVAAARPATKPESHRHARQPPIA